MWHILVVEDDVDIVKVVRTYLEREGYGVSIALDGLTGLTLALEIAPDLIVLDWMLPGIDGLALMKRLRRERNTPVIMLSARSEAEDLVRGLEGGADDYLVKPFSPRELLARVRSMQRRVELMAEPIEQPLRRGPLVIDPGRRCTTLEAVPIELTALEFDLLYTLASQPGRVFRRDELLSRVWGDDFAGVDRVVDVHISNLRGKLAAKISATPIVITLRGVGYKFSEDLL